MVGTDRGASLGRRIGALGLTLVLLVGTLVVGWLVWSVVEWRHGRTPSYRILGLRVVRRSDAQPIGLGRSLLRSGICCPLLVVPTVVIGGVVGLCFAMGASPPDGLLREPRTAPWDSLTATKVLDERALSEPAPGVDERPIEPVNVPGPTVPGAPRTNGHGPG
jgi:RDD family